MHPEKKEVFAGNSRRVAFLPFSSCLCPPPPRSSVVVVVVEEEGWGEGQWYFFLRGVHRLAFF